MLEKFHHYRFCPQCRAPVLSSHRFCTKCFCWLSRPADSGLRNIDSSRDLEVSWTNRLWLQVRLFQASLHFVVVGVILGVTISLLTVVYARALLPGWLGAWQTDVYRSSCYSNMRAIQTSLESYLLEKKFTPQLASDPAGVLHEARYLSDRRHCPIAGNLYRIPRGSSLQCIGSFGHGLP